MNKFTIIRDSREKANHGWVFNEGPYCDGMIIDKVSAGDYTILGMENYIAIERKRTIDEFAHNCIEKRWTKCMQRLSEIKFAFILFEFSWQDILDYPASAKVPVGVKRKLKIPSAYIRKIIYTARDKYNIHVLVCNDTFKAEKAAYRIMKKANELFTRKI